MSEQRFLLVIGIFLWSMLAYSAYYDSVIILYIFAGYLTFEAITNIRLTTLFKHFEKSSDQSQISEPPKCSSLLGKVEADRVVRILIAAFIYIPLALLPDLLWFMPWFIAGMLIMAGITNICPMHMLLKWAGLR